MAITKLKRPSDLISEWRVGTGFADNWITHQVFCTTNALNLGPTTPCDTDSERITLDGGAGMQQERLRLLHLCRSAKNPSAQPILAISKCLQNVAEASFPSHPPFLSPMLGLNFKSLQVA